MMVSTVVKICPEKFKYLLLVLILPENKFFHKSRWDRGQIGIRSGTQHFMYQKVPNFM